MPSISRIPGVSGSCQSSLARNCFIRAEGQKLKVPLMSQYGSYSYYENSRFQAVCLPYKTSRLAMYVFLPAKKSSPRGFRSYPEFRFLGQVDATVRANGRSHSAPPLQADISGDAECSPFTAWDGASLRTRNAPDSMPSPRHPRRSGLKRSSIWRFVEVNEEGTEAAANRQLRSCLYPPNTGGHEYVPSR